MTSALLIAVYSILMRTSFSLGTGISTSPISRVEAGPGAFYTMALIILLEPSILK
jgi:hypothetical protein